MELKSREISRCKRAVVKLGVLTGFLLLATACQEAPLQSASIDKLESKAVQAESARGSEIEIRSGTIFLVRHAEKTAEKQDPDLTEAGAKRAADLAIVLKNAEITHIHSSDYKRTRNTAAPLAKALGLSVELYDPRDLPAMAETLKTAGGRHLVVGHSNTTPQLTELLGGTGGTPIVETTEYDRLYVVTLG